MSFLFHFSALSVLPFWFMMILLPGWSGTRWLVKSPWIILPPTLCYLLLGAPHVGALVGAFDQPGPESLAAVMGQPWAASMFWAYAGAFDLFVGRWMFWDAIEHKVPHLLLAPALIVAIFFGPLGFSLYALVRGGLRLVRRN